MSVTAKNTKTVNIGRDRFEYRLAGELGPVIVLLNGFRMPLDNWQKLYPEIETYGRVLSYNRSGVGRSTKASSRQTGDVVVAALRDLLSALDLPPPYILVAHSLGGIFANPYARSRADEVSAVVFVEAAHPDESRIQRDFKPPQVVRAINDGLKAIERIFDEFKYSEDDHLDETIRQIEAASDFPSVPLAVVTGSKKMPFVPQESFELHLQYQEELLKLSQEARQYIAEHSGHFPQITEPDVVLAAVRETTAKVQLANNKM